VLLEQALVNVLDNASRYAPAGTTITITGETSAEGGIAIAVDDEGPGIPPNERERVFDLFYRVNKGDGRGKGTGLGLSISRGILEAHGGTISALPGPAGAGTRIRIVLPPATGALVHPPEQEQGTS
jgi:two-component system sensor histidine kinase KdpD